MIDFGHGVILRRLEEADLGTILTWRNDKRVWGWCRQYDLIPFHAHKKWFERQGSDPTIAMYGICTTDAHRHDYLIGVCGLTSIDHMNKRAEFSLYVSPDDHGHGYGTKALKTLFDHGFYNHGLNCIWGETFDGNPAAKIFERIGMVKEGTRRDFYFRNGKYIDCHLYSVLRRDWDFKLQAGRVEGIKFDSADISEPWSTAHQANGAGFSDMGSQDENITDVQR